MLHRNEISLPLAFVNDIFVKLLPKIVDSSKFEEDLKNFAKKNKNQTPEIDQKPRNEDKICSAILKAFKTTKKIMTCLKFNKLHEAYNSFADAEISKKAKKIEESVPDVTLFEDYFDNYSQNMPTSTYHYDLDENYKYSSQQFEKSTTDLIPQIMMVIGIPVIHSEIKKKR